MANYSVYPDKLDGYASLPLVRNQIDEVRAEVPNRLRDAIIKIEQELGIQPSGTFATVRARLDEIGDVRTIFLAHLADPEDAHDASAISVLDENDNYFEDDVEGVLAELGSLVPPQPDVVGENNSKVPNDGIPDWFDGYGSLFAFNISGANAENVLKKTQPRDDGIRGIQIVDISSNHEQVGGYKLRLGGGVGTERLAWELPTDPATVIFDSTNSVDISQLDAGDIRTLTAVGDSSKKIRIARTSEPYRSPPRVDEFAVLKLDAARGHYSLPSEGFKLTEYITRTSTDSVSASFGQSAVRGMVFPADRGTLVLQRKLRGAGEFFPIAVLNLKNIFNDTIRDSGQGVYTPSLENFDTIMLYDRVPVDEDYSLYEPNADGEDRYEDYENKFTRLQVARYMIPLSNPDIVGGNILSPDDTTETEANDKVSAYRIIHYTTENTSADFSGDPATTEVYSNIETSVPDLNENPQNFTRITNFYLDDSGTRPGIEHINLKPVKKEVNSDNLVTGNIRYLSGISYYTNILTNDNKFEVELRSDNNVFNKTYVVENTLRFETNVFNFPNGEAAGTFGAQVDITELLDDGYVKYSTSNLPEHNDQAFYFAKDAGAVATGIPSIDTRLFPAPNKFTTRAWIRARMFDPFGPGDGYDAYGEGFVERILVNSYSETRATDTTEWFTDESYRVTDGYEFFGPINDAYQDPPLVDPQDNISSIGLQCGGRFTEDESDIPGLIYPQNDYTVGNGIVPNNSSEVRDYAGLTGDRVYQRTFNLGYTISKARLQVVSGGNSPVAFENIRYKHGNDRARFGKIEVKIPGVGTNSTGWLDIGRLFKTGEYEDGYGALSGAVEGSAGNFTVPFTFGPRNTADTSDQIAVRITYFGQTPEERRVSKEKIITMVKLLPGEENE